VRQVGQPVAQWCGHGGHRYVDVGAVRWIGTGAVGPGGEQRSQPGGGDVEDIGVPGGKARDALLVHVEADDQVTGLRRPDRQRQARVALADDDFPIRCGEAARALAGRCAS